MATTVKLTIRVTERQHQIIKNRMQNEGYMKLSQYARDCMMRDDLSTLMILREIKGILTGDRENERSNKLEKK